VVIVVVVVVVVVIAAPRIGNGRSQASREENGYYVGETHFADLLKG